MPDTPAAAVPAVSARFLCLIPAPSGDEWHIATRGGRLVTTTERSQVALGRIGGRRAPLIAADNVGTGQMQLPTVDLFEMSLDQGSVPTAPAAE
ncbi:hypothetical protein [Blastococcus sp. CT_GayMR16]|uniref:hypothetical protein n=1 Tax=Blastococcus sp. CT_GayMR16 TaxID=2559607 RepID=UPI0010736FC9|nr:hypothetical protein [Blastococcus sp. CT_GayMR16]TFV90424.1 hypothetical protein E4P38_03005 [Blastococcus sp. CT_GayMR16]